MHELTGKIQEGDVKSLARAISLVENSSAGYEALLLSLPQSATPVIGITGPPGAGKSTLADALIGEIVSFGKRVSVLCVDPTSPFNYGALLGDRIRMSSWYNHPLVYIRSLASRGSLGGLHPTIVEITDLMRSAPFDYLIVETVGVGQSEVEIAGLADVTVVVLVPESGDEVQTMKAGLMEIADIFVINKADRPDTDSMVKHLRSIQSPLWGNRHKEVPVLKTIASQKQGTGQLFQQIEQLVNSDRAGEKKIWLWTEKAYLLLQHKRMQHISRLKLQEQIKSSIANGNFNLYAFVEQQLQQYR